MLALLTPLRINTTDAALHIFQQLLVNVFVLLSRVSARCKRKQLLANMLPIGTCLKLIWNIYCTINANK